MHSHLGARIGNPLRSSATPWVSHPGWVERSIEGLIERRPWKVHESWFHRAIVTGASDPDKISAGVCPSMKAAAVVSSMPSGRSSA